MTDPDDRPVDLDRIAGPAVPPSQEADPLTAQEGKKLQQAAKKLTPTDHAIIARDRHVADACDERERLRKERDGFQFEATRQARELAELSSENASLRQQLHASRASFGFAALAQVGGGTAISLAGAISHSFWKPASLVGGISVFVFGSLLALWSLFVGKRVGHGRGRAVKN
jgi:hypothetical protein